MQGIGNKQSNEASQKKIDEKYVFENVTILKVVAALAIFVLHEGAKHENTQVVALMRFAVPMFFYMSAIIYGTRPLDYFGAKFFCKRLKSLSYIYVPYVLCASFMLIFALHYPIMQVVKQTVIDLLFLGGLFPSIIPVCGHLWFLTYLIIFYGLLMVVSWILLKNDKYRKIITCLLFAMAVVNSCWMHKAKLYYLTGYLLLFLNSRLLLDAVKNHGFVKVLSLLIGLALLSMPIFRPSFDDGNLTGCLAAVLIILGTNYAFVPPPILKRLSKMSMAFYLVHQILVCEIDSIPLALILTLVLSSIFTDVLNVDNLKKLVLKINES